MLRLLHVLIEGSSICLCAEGFTGDTTIELILTISVELLYSTLKVYFVTVQGLGQDPSGVTRQNFGRNSF